MHPPKADKCSHGTGSPISAKTTTFPLSWVNTLRYEIENINRFPTVQDFASYARLVKCTKESNGKKAGTGGKKIGNAHLTWAFSEAAALFLKGNEPGKKYLDRLANKHGKGKALSILAHKIGRAVYFMLKNNKPFDQNKFLGL